MSQTGARPSAHPHARHPHARHPHAVTLRLRAADLRLLADRIERSRVVALDVDQRHRPLARAVLARNVQQLLLAADDLRWTAFRLATRAAEIDCVRSAPS